MAASLFFHHYFDFIVAADFPLVELPPAEESPARFRVHAASELITSLEPDSWDWEWELPSGEVFLQVAQGDQGSWLRFPGLLDVVYRRPSGQLQLFARPQASAETVRHLLVDHVLPRLVGHEGRLVLHAAAVAGEGGSLVIIGAAGAGKSTLAARLCRAGHELLTDDCVLLEPVMGGYRALPAYTGLRLWHDSLAEMVAAGWELPDQDTAGWKSRLSLAPVGRGDRGVRALFVLRDSVPAKNGDAVIVRRIHGGQALLELLQHGFLIDPTDRQVQERQFLAAGELAQLAPVFEVTYPRDFSRLTEVCSEILATEEEWLRL